MSEKPILFSGPMVRALLAGTKTQTRRIVKPKIVTGAGIAGIMGSTGPAFGPSPYGEPGDRLWVRETFAKRQDCKDDTDRARHYLMFKADGGDPKDEMNWHDYGGKWTSAIFMPRWASRITLEVTGVRVERLQDISCADAIAEGIRPAANSQTIDCDTPDPRVAYRELWDGINGKKAPWSSNPYVWVLEFKHLPPGRRDL